MTRICVFVPVKNGMPLIQDTIGSIIKQTAFRDLQVTLCICDGQSSDGTLRYAKEIEGKCKEVGIKYVLVSRADRGMYDGMSYAMETVGLDHDIYCYINAGDYFAPYAFREVALLFRRRIQWVTGLNAYYNQRGVLTRTVLPVAYPGDLIRQGFFGALLPFIQQESTFWSVGLQAKIDLRRLAGYRFAGDAYLWYTFSQFETLVIAKAWLSGFRQHEGQLSAARMAEYRQEFNAIRDRRVLLSYVKAGVIWGLLRLPQSFKLALSRSIVRV